jgi:DnaK suppressor protein
VTNTRYEELQQTLETRKRELQSDLDMKLRDVRANSAYDGETRGGLDTAEHSNAELQQDLGVSLMEMRCETLRRVTDALTRLANGSYGYCAECAGEISERRLEALPFAVRCRECEVVHETSERRSRQITETRLSSFKWLAEASED